MPSPSVLAIVLEAEIHAAGAAISDVQVLLAVIDDGLFDLEDAFGYLAKVLDQTNVLGEKGLTRRSLVEVDAGKTPAPRPTSVPSDLTKSLGKWPTLGHLRSPI